MIHHRVLWLLVLTGPMVWILSFGAEFALSGWACTWGSKLPLYLVSIAALLLTAAAGGLAFAQWRALGKGLPGEAGGAISRARAMAVGGIALNLMFFVVVIGQSIPQLLLVGCE